MVYTDNPVFQFVDVLGDTAINMQDTDFRESKWDLWFTRYADNKRAFHTTIVEFLKLVCKTKAYHSDKAFGYLGHVMM